MAIDMHLAADGFIHMPCPGPDCQVRFKIAPPKACDHFHCPLAACGCRFAIARKGWVPAAAVPQGEPAGEPDNVWAAVTDAAYADRTTGGTFFEQTRYPHSRRNRGTAVGAPAHTRWAGYAGRAAAVAAVLLLGIGLSIELLALADESAELGDDSVLAGPEPGSPDPAAADRTATELVPQPDPASPALSPDRALRGESAEHRPARNDTPSVLKAVGD